MAKSNTSNQNHNSKPNLADPPAAANLAEQAVRNAEITASFGLVTMPPANEAPLAGPAVPPLVTELRDGRLPNGTFPANAPPLTPPSSPTVSQETPVAPVARQGDSGRPFCEVHQCLMRANGTRDMVTNYSCPVPRCDCKEKRARPQVRIARDPQVCPATTCQRPRQEFLELVPGQSNHAIAHMQCPKCGFSMKVPKPQFAEMVHVQSKRPPKENFSDR